MSNFWNKIRGSWINSLLFSCFLLAIFLGLFYLANWNFKPNANIPHISEESEIKNTDEEIKKRLGSTEVSSLGYADWAKVYGLDNTNNAYDADPDGDGLPNYLEYAHLTNPLNPDTDGDGFSDQKEIANGYDPDAPGDAKPLVEVSIDKIKVSAPMIWSQTEDENQVLEDLKSGLSHFPKTAAPGENGNMIISGHSSNYFWVKGDYNHIFSDLNNLEAGDMVTITVAQHNSRVLTYHYQVTKKEVVSPTDPKIFENTSSPTLTLSTCWPLGTNLKRLIVRADLVK